MTYETRTVQIPTFQVKIGDKWFKLGDIMCELAGLEDTDSYTGSEITEPGLGRILMGLGVIQEHGTDRGYVRSVEFDAFNKEMRALDKAHFDDVMKSVNSTKRSVT